MEKLVILLVVAIGSAISSYVQNKRKREEEEKLGGSPSPRSGQPPIPHWPRSAPDWQEEVRRLLSGEVPPEIPPQRREMPPQKVSTPVVRAKVTPRETRRSASEQVHNANQLKQSATAYARASSLQGRVENRLQAVDALTKKHPVTRPEPRRSSAASVTIRRWTKNRQSLREAFVASLIFAPPVALAPPAEPQSNS